MVVDSTADDGRVQILTIRGKLLCESGQITIICPRGDTSTV